MSLFERIKYKRYDLQEKKKFPGDESGAYKQAKDDLEARKGFSKNKPGGLITPPAVSASLPLPIHPNLGVSVSPV